MRAGTRLPPYSVGGISQMQSATGIVFIGLSLIYR